MTLTNIETKIICANSLKNIQPDLFSPDAIAKLKVARLKYYKPNLSIEEKRSVTDDIVTVLDSAFPSFSTEIMGKHIAGQNKELLRHWFTHATVAAPFFNLEFFYPELEGQGFDCVIGNPPYGGTKISDDVRKDLGIDSKDPYGAFIARFLASCDKQTPLKDGGVLAYIVSDTFMTIKSHHALRRQMMDNYIHKMIRVHPDTFKATVNTAIIICERNRLRAFNQDHVCQMVDMTNVSVHDSYSRFVELLGLARGVDFEVVRDCVSNEEYGIYYYPQGLIRTNSNLPFFVASPKLFALMNDSNDPSCMPKTINQEIGGKILKVRKIEMNGKEVQVVKLGDIADVRKGIDTGNNDLFLYQIAESRGNYRDIGNLNGLIISDDELREICKNEKLREIIKYKGFSLEPNKPNFYKGKYIIPYEKGGESDIESGWLPNFYVPNAYFIDWSENSVKNLFAAQHNNQNKATLRNQGYWFKSGLTFSLTGFYAPTVRLKSPSMFDNKSSGIFTLYDEFISICILTSRIQKFLMKNFLMHTIDTQVGVFDDSAFVINSENENLLISHCQYFGQN